MKRLVLILVIGVSMFAASAGVSEYLRRAKAALEEKTQAAEHSAEDPAKAVSADKAGQRLASTASLKPASAELAPPVAQRPTPPTAESVTQFAKTLQQQQDHLQARERQLQVRQKHLEIIYEDLRKERTGLDELRQQLNQEMKALTGKIDALDRKSTDIDKQKEKLIEQNKEFKQTLFEMDNVEQKNIKRVSATFDAMDAAAAGEFLLQMANTGKMDMAAKVLATMKERQAAGVLDQMQDKGAALQIIERMNNFKRSGAAP